jgi:hypothetical protein
MAMISNPLDQIGDLYTIWDGLTDGDVGNFNSLAYWIQDNVWYFLYLLKRLDLT